MLVHLVLCHANFLSIGNDRSLVELNHRPDLPVVFLDPLIYKSFTSCTFTPRLAVCIES